MHMWGDRDFDWEGLASAITSICNRLRWWRVGCWGKEKYGRADISVQFGWRSLHDIIWPGYCYRQWPRNRVGNWLCYADIYIWPTLFRPLNWIIVPLHKAAYRRAYLEATKRWPHLIAEVLHNADHEDILYGN